MSRFNQTTTKPSQIENLAGGLAYQQSAEMELVSILLTSFATDQFYRSAKDTFDRLKLVISKCSPKFVAQAAIYARTTFGMRSITHVVAAELAKHVTGEVWAKNFYNAVIFRPDDMMEILSYYTANCAVKTARKGGKAGYKYPNALKQGFALAFNKFNKYQLAKYRGEGKEFKLIDIVNLVHPIPTDGNREAITALVKGELKSFDTWESELTKAGQSGETDEQVDVLKEQVWSKLVKEKKLGYLALLRNLRNIMEQAPDVLRDALISLTDPVFIKKSLIFPFQYLIAYKQFSALNTRDGRVIADALSRAIDVSCENVKSLNFSGNTLVAVDNSGSMDTSVATSPHMKRSELGALFGIVLAKAINADIMEFGDRARYINYSLSTSSMDFGAKFSQSNQVGHGTNFSDVLLKANKKYDRIIYFSDMQGWIGHNAANHGLAAYNRKFAADPFIYSFDLAGLGSLQFPENKVFALAGFSNQTFDVMKALEIDRKALLSLIKKVEF